MKKEIIFVPQSKCPLDILSEMEEKIKNSWILFHENLIEELSSSSDKCFCTSTAEMTIYRLSWNSKNTIPKTEITLKSITPNWFFVSSISANDIAFERSSDNPTSLYFFLNKIGD